MKSHTEKLRKAEASRLFNSKLPFLQNHKFWFFFYGYDIFQGIRFNDDKWPLVKLVLSFTNINNSNIDVEITNTDDSEHHDYVGTTDFITSAENVLVINCRTKDSLTRQLNIKLHIGTGRGNIFLGQYLNYESDGRIISGNIIVQRILGGIEPIPVVHRVKKLAPHEKSYKSDYEGVDRSILQYLHDKKINFRRNPLRAGHELETFREWLELYKDEESGPTFFENSDAPNTLFKPFEIKQLQERVKQVEEKIIDLKLPSEAEKAINEVVEDVPEKAKRLTKRELLDVITGALVKQGIQWGLTIEHIQAIWAAFQHFFN